MRKWVKLVNLLRKRKTNVRGKLVITRELEKERLLGTCLVIFFVIDNI